MSQQAEIAFRILMRLYIELDQRAGWATEKQVVDVMKRKEGVAEGRTHDALGVLRRLKMLEYREREGAEEFKISSYGVAWFEKTCPMTSREPTYKFEVPFFGGIKLVGPDEFYKTKNARAGSGHTTDWTKWGAIAGIAALPLAIFIAWYSV